jgi:hypothetical protein
MSLIAIPLILIAVVGLLGPVIAGIFLAVRLSSRRTG